MLRFLTGFVLGLCIAGMSMADEVASNKRKTIAARGAEATLSRIKRGFEAASYGIGVGISAAGRGITRGAEATSNTLHKVTEKNVSSEEKADSKK